MARQTKADKLIDEQVYTAYAKHFDCVQVNMMDLGKIMNTGRDALKTGQNLDKVMSEAVAVYRQD